MKRKKPTPEEIVHKLRQAETLVVGVKNLEVACKEIEVSVPNPAPNHASTTQLFKEPKNPTGFYEEPLFCMQAFPCHKSVLVGSMRSLMNTNFRLRHRVFRNYPEPGEV